MLGCRAMLPVLQCPHLYVLQPLANPQPLPATPHCLHCLFPSKATALQVLQAPCACKEKVSSSSGWLCAAVCCCRCCSPPSVGISAVVLSMSLAWQRQGTVPL